jgi:hypothetical protein
VLQIYKPNPYLEITYLVMIINHFTITYIFFIFFVDKTNGNQYLLKFEKKYKKKKYKKIKNKNYKK